MLPEVFASPFLFTSGCTKTMCGMNYLLPKAHAVGGVYWPFTWRHTRERARELRQVPFSKWLTILHIAVQGAHEASAPFPFSNFLVRLD